MMKRRIFEQDAKTILKAYGRSRTKGSARTRKNQSQFATLKYNSLKRKISG
ncbi:hypothetical protein SESBI_17880 [Sesbania bispinosa]|nr:hypothetical protein SESBI_17880 [Sesbania bispinosa]